MLSRPADIVPAFEALKGRAQAHQRQPASDQASRSSRERPGSLTPSWSRVTALSVRHRTTCSISPAGDTSISVCQQILSNPASAYLLPELGSVSAGRPEVDAGVDSGVRVFLRSLRK